MATWTQVLRIIDQPGHPLDPVVLQAALELLLAAGETVLATDVPTNSEGTVTAVLLVITADTDDEASTRAWRLIGQALRELGHG